MRNGARSAVVRNYKPKRFHLDDVGARVSHCGFTHHEFALLADIPMDHVMLLVSGQMKPCNRIRALLSIMSSGCRHGGEKARKFLAKVEPEWRPIPGYSRYEVSAEGRVRKGYRILNASASDVGHLRVTVYTDYGQQSTLGIHRAICLAWHGPATSPANYACHKNGDPADNRPDNIYWGTAADNARDRVEHSKLGHMRGRITWDRKGKPLDPKKHKGKLELIPGCGYAKMV